MIKRQINRSKAGCNLDAIVTESEIHLIISKQDRNINQGPNQQIKNQIKTRYNSDAIWMQSRANADAIGSIFDVIQMQNLDAIITESEMHLITSKLNQNINQKPD